MPASSHQAISALRAFSSCAVRGEVGMISPYVNVNVTKHDSLRRKRWKLAQS
jgi:hypothetical protein